MKVNKSGFFWGILLIIAGAYAILQQLGYTQQISPWVWTAAFAVVSLMGLVSYALSGWKEWGWLFPAGIFGGLAITGALAIWGYDNPAMASPLFVGLAIPFGAAYLTDRPRNWWALIPGGMMLFLALVTVLAENARGEWIGSLFLFLIAVSFLAVYLGNRSRWWALLVAYILAVLSVAPLMAIFGDTAGGYFGAVFLFAAALPFFVIYIRTPARWWAVIPAGALTVLAFVTALAVGGLIASEADGVYVNVLLMGGLAATFALVWLRNGKSWAKIVTIVLAALAVISVFFISSYNLIWPIVLLLAGGYLLYTALRRQMA